jgi:hypothetical protein
MAPVTAMLCNSCLRVVIGRLLVFLEVSGLMPAL